MNRDSAWPRTADGQLDLDRSPLTLNAIVNRTDLRDLDDGHAGEGRFVFAVNSPGSTFPQQFTIILEYRLPARSLAEREAWAEDWHVLGILPFPSPQYNAKLQEITDRFSARNAEPARINGSALRDVPGGTPTSPTWSATCASRMRATYECPAQRGPGRAPAL
jgi:hypothetical protein